MCGRFTLTADFGRLQERFHFDPSGLAYEPSYNIAPGQPVLAVVQNDSRQAKYLRWGLVPFWATDPAIGNRMINARGETVADKPSFRRALRQRRCLILADGFYEWRRAGKLRQPMYIGFRDRRPFAFAGLWERWQPPHGAPLYTCTIVTTEANALVRPIHARMPVVLEPAGEELWLDHRLQEAERVLPLLQPYAKGDMQAYPVTRRVNAPQYNSPECLVPLQQDEDAP
jgi:putative SOS response-associated peptidase YedK